MTGIKFDCNRMIAYSAAVIGTLCMLYCFSMAWHAVGGAGDARPFLQKLWPFVALFAVWQGARLGFIVFHETRGPAIFAVIGAIVGSATSLGVTNATVNPFYTGDNGQLLCLAVSGLLVGGAIAAAVGKPAIGPAVWFVIAQSAVILTLL